jgi:16S rRNA pseudouridine516 synthase
MSIERLDKIIASQSTFSRKDARNLIKDGGVSVNGEVVTSPDAAIDTDKDTLALFDKAFRVKRFVYIMLNKPAGILSAAKDARSKTVIDLLPVTLYRRGLFPTGRLDKDTTGFMLITDDGDFAHRILSPKNHVFKTYEARLREPLQEGTCVQLAQGITLGDGTQCLPAFVEVIEDEAQPLVRVKIREGKYHQIKRMFAAIGNEVLALKRTQIGELALDEKLKEGECRELNSAEIAKLAKDGPGF